MSPTLSEAVARYAEAVGTTVDEAENDLTVVVSERAEAASAGAVPIWDAEVLRRIDTPVVSTDLAVAGTHLAGDAAWHRMRSSAVSLEDAARLLDVSASAVRRVIGDRPATDAELLGVKDSHGRWRLFAYQLPDAGGRGGEPGTRLGRRVQRSLPPRDAPGRGRCVVGRTERGALPRRLRTLPAPVGGVRARPRPGRGRSRVPRRHVTQRLPPAPAARELPTPQNLPVGHHDRDPVAGASRRRLHRRDQTSRQSARTVESGCRSPCHHVQAPPASHTRRPGATRAVGVGGAHHRGTAPDRLT